MTEQITVAVRVRPLNSQEKAAKDTQIHTNTATSISISNPEKKDEKSFTFDYVYGTDSQQDEIFKDLGIICLENAWAGFNCTLFAYGQTGSGKSYSMTGNLNLPEQKGIIPRFYEEMFNRITSSSNENVSYEIKISFLEIYNEKIKDLLDPKSQKTIYIRESLTKGIYLENIIEQPVESLREFKQILSEGNKLRTLSTATNKQSRAHSILTIFFSRKELIQDQLTQRDARVNLVDLAGSERLSQTETTGERLTEACVINRSLSAFGNVIYSLAQQKENSQIKISIPYMDSLITRILRDSLGGNYKTIMLSTISPINSNYEESLMTLQYSELAKQIKNNPISNSYNNQEEIQALQEEIEILKAQSINKPFQNYESVQSQESISKFVSINISQNEEIASSDPSERKQSFKESKQGNFEFAEDIEQEIDFQEKLRSAQEKLDKKRVELILQQEQTYRRESSIYRQKQILAQQLSLLKLEQTTNEEKIEPALQIAERGQELEDETKEIMNQIHDQSIMEDEIARRQAWIDEQRGIREQTVTDLLILLKRLADLTNALEQKKQSQEIANHRKQYLSDMGLSFCETEEVEGTDNQQPQIRNISTDKDLDGHLVYLLPDGVVEVGSYKSETIRSSRKNFILLHGLGIAPTHFAIFYNQKKNTVRLRTIGEEKVLINGQWFGGKKRNEEIDLISTFKSTDTLQINEIDLNDQDRIVIGRNTAFRFINKSENVLKQKTITQQQYNEDDLIQAELAVASGRYSNISDFFSKSQVHEKWLLDVDEANSIVNTLGRKLNYSVEIEHLTMKINIIVNSYERGGGKQTWPLSLLQNRLPLMRSVLNSFLENGIIEDQPELDPFFNPPQDELIGVAQISLRSLMLTGALRVGLSIRSTNFVDEDQIQYQPNGEKKGELKLSMTLKYRKDESIHEQQLQMRNAPKNTFIHLEARDFREPLPNLPILNPVVVKLRHIPDEKLIWDHEVSLTMDFKLISLNKKVQETEGIFIRFFFPYDQEQITPRIYDPGKLGLSATYETHRSNTGSDELSQYEDLLSKSIGKTTTISDFAETVVPDKHLKVLNIKQKFIFPTFSQTDFEFLMKTKLNFEIWGHEQEISESIHILTPRSRLREKIRLNEHNRIQIEMQQNSNSIEKAQKEFDQHQKDLVEMQKQLDALVQRRKNLDEVDSKTCCFIL